MKNLLLTFVILLFANVAISQTTLGFKIGGNVDFIEAVVKGDTLGSDSKTTNLFYGAHFGMALNVPIYEDIISFSPELVLFLRSDFDDPISTYLADVQIPLLFTCYVYPDFGIDLGPELHYQGINASKDAEDEWVNNIEGEAGPKNFDFGIAGGVRFRITDYAFIAGRFYLGLNNLFPTEELQDNYKIWSRSAQISFIYQGRGR